MKKFLFTLAAMLMTMSVFAQSDAKYLYVNTDLCEVDGTDLMLVLSAEFPAYLNSFDCTVNVPEGVTIYAVEAGADYPITYYLSNGRERTASPAISWTEVNPNKFVVACMQGGYDYVDGVLTDVTTVKWGPDPAVREEFIVVWATIDENFHGGNITVTTIPSSGIDPRTTINDLGDKSREITTDATEPLEDPNPSVVQQPVEAPTFTITSDADYVYVTVNWPETDGNHVYNGQAQYARPEYGQPDESYDVEAYTTETEAYEESAHGTTTVDVPAKDPVWQDVDAPVISYVTTATQVIVTVTWPTTTGNQVYTGEYTYDRPAYGEADQSYAVEAYTEADYPYSESAHATETIPVPAQDPVWQAVDAPVIETSMDADYVYVTITWPETTGEHIYNGQYSYERGESEYDVTVEAYTEADYPYSESAHATLPITVPAKEPVVLKTYVKVENANQLVAGKKYIFVCGDYAMGGIVNGFGSVVEVTRNRAADEVKAPESIELTLGGEAGAWTLQFANGLYLTAANSTGLGEGENATNWVITNGNDGELAGYRAKHADYNRAIRKHNSMDRFGNYSVNDNNSDWAWIYVEKEDTPALEQTESPSIDATNHFTPVYNDEGEQIGTENGWYEVTVTATEGGELEYRYQYEDGEWTDWMPYVEGENGEGVAFTNEGHYVVEAREKAEGKDWSEPVEAEFTVTTRTAIDEIMGGKAIANVRYFNLAGQEMQEANGMTIVVTTYTDGTTSAVKVMK